jgi:tetratricopeptide (TPR) repeat protein
VASEPRDDPAQLPLGGSEGTPFVPPTEDQVALALERGETALVRRDVVSASAAFREALSLAPGHVRATLRLSTALDTGGDPAAALAELDRAVAQHPDNVSLLVGRAALASARLRYAQAEGDLRRALKLTDSNAEVYLQLGILDCRRARWREAIEPLRRAIELDPTLAGAHYHLGEAYNHVDQLDKARGAYERAAELEPQHWRALQGLGVVYDRLGRPVEATAAYKRSREAQKA